MIFLCGYLNGNNLKNCPTARFICPAGPFGSIWTYLNHGPTYPIPLYERWLRTGLPVHRLWPSTVYLAQLFLKPTNYGILHGSFAKWFWLVDSYNNFHWSWSLFNKKPSKLTISAWWLTVNPSEKYDFVSWDYDIPNLWLNLTLIIGSSQPCDVYVVKNRQGPKLTLLRSGWSPVTNNNEMGWSFKQAAWWNFSDWNVLKYTIADWLERSEAMGWRLRTNWGNQSTN